MESEQAHTLAKPSFDAFKLQFTGTRSHVADQVPKEKSDDQETQDRIKKEDESHAVEGYVHGSDHAGEHKSEQKRLEELGIGLDDDLFFTGGR